MATVEVKVPDIGDFEDVAVIEVLVKPGDTVKAEQSLITVESDKASMEIPSTTAAWSRSCKVKLGDKVTEGSVLLVAGEATRLRRRLRRPPRPRRLLRPPAPAPATPAAPPRLPAPRPRPGRSRSACPTSATSRTSPSSSCWSSRATRSRPSSR